MSSYNELVSILKELLLNRFYPIPYYISALLGDGNGKVLVPGRPDYNYVRFNRASSETFEVFNKEVSQPVDGWPVKIGEFPWQPGLIQVVGTDWSAYSQTGWGDSVASIQAHAPTHEWPTFAPGSDPVNVYLRALTPLRTQAVGSGSNSIYVTAYEYDWTGTNTQWPGVPPLDFSAKPPSGSMLYMGIYLNPGTNSLGVISGSTTVYTDALEPSLPNWPLGVFPSGYVRLYGGQAGISERDIRPAQRLYHPSLMFTGTASGGGAWPFDFVKSVSSTNVDADYPLLSDAIAGVSDGMGVLLDAETLAETGAVTLNKFIYVKGFDKSVSIVNRKVTVSLSAALEKLQVFTEADNEAVEVTSSNGAVFTDCKFTVVNGTDSKALLIRRTMDLVDVEAVANSGSGNRYAIYATPAVSLALGVYGGLYRGATADIFADAGATITLHGPVLYNASASNVPIAGTGTVVGYYYDLAGNKYTRPNTKVNLGDGATTAPLSIIARAAAPSSPVNGDVYLDDGTNVANGLASLRARIGGAWVDVPNLVQLPGGVWLHRGDGLRVRYATIADALTAAASSGDTVRVLPGVYTEQLTVSKSVTIIGSDPLNTIITFADSASYTLYLTAAGIRLENLTIANTGAGAASGCIQADDNDIVLRNCIINKTSGAATTSYGVWVYGGSGAGIRLEDCRVSVTAGTNKYGILNNVAAAVITVEAGQIGGDTADISGDQAGSTLTVYDCALTNGYTSWAGDVAGQYFGTKLVTNSSGATAPGRDVGYINTDGDYVTTTTANLFTGSNCIVVVSGGNTKKCFVATAGRWPVRYAGSAPNDGDFLVTSTTAGAAAAQATMRPDIFARCQAGGASNVVTALLLTGSEFVAIAPATLLYSNTAGSDTSFTATINGAPGATSVVYNAPSAGSEDVIKPGGSGQLFKAVLHNTTRGTSRLIDDVNTGTNTITTISSTDAWASGDTITIQSQVVSTGGSPFAVDLDGSQDTNVPLLAREIMLEIQRRDSTLPANVAIHPHETYSSTKLQTTQCQVVNTILSDVRIFPLINRRFDMINNAGGSATADVFIKVFGYFAASP